MEKATTTFLVFLPRFVEPGRGPIPKQVLALGLIHVSLALVTDGDAGSSYPVGS